MRGKSDEEILSERNRLIEEAEKAVGEDIEVLDSFFGDFDGNALGFLGESIGLLSSADIAVFGEGWQDARGCRVERLCCKEYDIIVLDV
jgi:hypothetical protein